MSQCADIDEELDSGYSGTFRWKKSKRLPQLPDPIQENLLTKGPPVLSGGWKGYFDSRGRISGCNLVEFAYSDLSIVDCLSFPVSIAKFLTGPSLNIDWTQSYERIALVCIGCSEKAEERVARETNAFAELLYCLPNVANIDLWLVGPEMSEIGTVREHSLPSFTPPSPQHRISIRAYKGGATAFIRAHPEYLSKDTVVVGFNCGFGNFENPLPRRYELFLSWLPDLLFLASTQLPLVFFCANDYADLRGEVAILSMLGAHFISMPEENPFSFASTMIPPSGDSSSQATAEFSRGNSFLYAVQGSDRQRRLPELRGKPSPSSPDLLPMLLPHLSQRAIAARAGQVSAWLSRGSCQLSPVCTAHTSAEPGGEDVAVRQQVQGQALLVELSSPAGVLDLSAAELDLHRSGAFLLLRAPCMATGTTMHTSTVHIPLDHAVDPQPSAMTAKYSRRKATLSLRLTLRATRSG